MRDKKKQQSIRAARGWLDEALLRHGCTVETTLLATVDRTGKLYLVRREDVR